ncbi:MAG: hypothetical protein AAFX06_26690 [Planctomycetota bacterium]
MKKLSLAIVVAFGAFSLTGCSGSTTPDTIEQTQSQAEIDAQDADYEAEMAAAEEEENNASK